VPAAAHSDKRRDQDEVEQEVLGSLAQAEHGFTAAEVQMALGQELAYSTVVSTLLRLHRKAAVTRELEGLAYRYALAGRAGTEAHVAARQMLRLLGSTDRAQALELFVGALEAADLDVIAGLLAKHKRD
jgi:predicted transcriptional regulator